MSFSFREKKLTHKFSFLQIDTNFHSTIYTFIFVTPPHHRSRTNAETTFSNEYFRLLIEERWSPKISRNGKPWTGPDQFEDSTGKLMMLPSDIALIKDQELKKWVTKYAYDEDFFFKDFSKAFAKLLELGVPFATAVKPWYQLW